MRAYVPFQLVVGCFLAAIACSDDEEGKAPPVQLGQRNESCQTKADCMPPLVCVNETCSVDRFDVPPTGSECAVVACREAQDCCAQPSVTCTMLKTACDGGDTLACQQYDASCSCRFDCLNNACVQKCQTGTGGTSGVGGTGGTCTTAAARYCNGQNCVQCLCDSQCSTSQVCRGNKCLPRCEVDLDCAPMNRCDKPAEAEHGVCVRSGCTSDRECIASLSNVLAVCREGVCQVSCNADIECDTASEFNFRGCINGVCTDLGCESSDECRAKAKLPANSNQFAICRPRPMQEPPGPPPDPASCMGTGGTAGTIGTGGSFGTAGTFGSAGSFGTAGGLGTGGTLGSGGTTGTGDCCATHSTPGCINSTVQACVCSYSSACCTSTWSSTCVTYARSLCSGCAGTGGTSGTSGTGGTSGSSGSSGSGGTAGTLGLGSCCSAHATPFCDNLTVANCVCTSVPSCCSTAWTSTCVNNVTSLGCGTCP